MDMAFSTLLSLNPANAAFLPNLLHAYPVKITVFPWTKRTFQNHPQSKTHNLVRFHVFSNQAHLGVTVEEGQQLVNVPRSVSERQVEGRENLLA